MEVRQLDSAGRVEKTGLSGYPVGIYFGHKLAIEKDKTRVHIFSSLKFSDYCPEPARRIRRGIDYEDNLIIQSPLKEQSTLSRGVGVGANTAHVKELPGPWRRLEFTLTANAIEVGYGGDTEEDRALREAVRHRDEGVLLNKRIAKLQDMLNKPPFDEIAGHVTLPQWSSRRSFGLYVNGTSVEARNVVIIPLNPRKE